MTKCCPQCDSLQRAIDSCQREIEELESGHNPLPFGGETAHEILEERLEYLQGLKSSFIFIRDYPEREMQV